jgi:hypothetical protein
VTDYRWRSVTVSVAAQTFVANDDAVHTPWTACSGVDRMIVYAVYSCEHP